MRILSNRVAEHTGKTIKIEGWLHKKRLLGGLTFINVRDRAGIVQVLVEDKSEAEKLRGMQIGTVMSVEGKVASDERAPGGAELHDVKIDILVPVLESPPVEIDKPLDHKPDNLDTLFEYRVVGLRNLHETAIFKIRSDVNRYIREYLWNNDFTEIQTPKLLAEATEGGAEVFKLDYFGQEATLAQSPQLYKQIMVGVFERVFEIGPAFRAELSATTRHVSEVTMLDIEMGFIKNHGEVLDLVQDMVYKVVTKITDEYSDTFKKMGVPKVKIIPTFPSFTVHEIHEMYTKHTDNNTIAEKDLTPDEERWICEYSAKKYGCDAVFATHFPASAMKFYHAKDPENPDCVLWADLLFRGVEIATCPVREYHHDILVEQMKQAGLDPDHPGYRHYLQAFKYGLPIHGGCGFGIDRFVQKLMNLKNIREAILFPRDINRLSP
jgi:nondiscriminating aspartyl-tRNA synthetase